MFPLFFPSANPTRTSFSYFLFKTKAQTGSANDALNTEVVG
jgi:hypothetical protein